MFHTIPIDNTFISTPTDVQSVPTLRQQHFLFNWRTLLCPVTRGNWFDWQWSDYQLTTLYDHQDITKHTVNRVTQFKIQLASKFSSIQRTRLMNSKVPISFVDKLYVWEAISWNNSSQVTWSEYEEIWKSAVPCCSATLEQDQNCFLFITIAKVITNFFSLSELHLKMAS